VGLQLRAFAGRAREPFVDQYNAGQRSADARGALWPSSSIAAYAEALRRGEVTAQAVVERTLERIAAENAHFDAFTAVDADAARSAARAVDLLLAARSDVGPLMGVPVALKDLYAATGLPMTAGSRVDIADRVPREGPIVAALKRAGAVIVGKTRTTEFAFGTFNPTHPTPRNPRDRSSHRMPGGSSAGSAVAQAAGLCAVAFGTDTGGSVRQPAALCGVVGFKSTAGRLPMDGVFPLSPTFDSAGWFGDGVSDVALVWQTLSGEQAARERPVETLAFGVPDAHFADDIDDDVARAFDIAQRRLAAAGARIRPVTLPPLADLDGAFGAFLSAELVAYLGRDRVAASLSQMDPVVAARIAPGLTLTADAFLDMRARYAALAQRARTSIAGVDALLTPTCPRIAARVDGYAHPDAAAAWSRDTLRFTRPGNLFGLCGISLPIEHLTGSLPVGLQLLAAGGSDSRLLAIAATVERVLATTGDGVGANRLRE
jgi:aspartyl-tRNA(Asn)/glutamyl-tRNA(Gln) amidotransferase subunit A